MTDDVNKRKGPEQVNESSFNSIKEEESPYYKILEKRHGLIERTSAEELKLRQRIEKATEKRSKIEREILKTKAKIHGYTDLGQLSVDLPDLEKGVITSQPHLFKTKEEYESAKIYTPELEKASKKMLIKESGLYKDLATLEERKEAVAEKMFASSVEREVSATSTKTNVLAREPSTVVSAISEISKRPFLNYSKTRKQQQEEQGRLAEAVASASQNISSPGGIENYLQVSQELESKTKETAQDIARERAQKKRGFDVESQFNKASSLVDSEKARISSQEIREDINKGKTGSLTEEFKKLEDIGKKLNSTFEKFNKEIEDTGEAVEDTRIELEKQSEEYKKQKQVTEELERSGRDGGGSKYQTFGKILDAGTAVADAARYSFVTSEIQQRQARTGVADIVNQEYSDYTGAAKGDMSSLRRLSSKFYDRVRQDFKETKIREATIGTVETGLMGAGAIGTGIQEGSKAGLNLVGGAAAGTLAAIPGTMQAVKQGVDVGREISSTNAAIQMAAARRQLEDTANRIRDINVQEAYNYGTNAYDAMQGFGAGTGSKAFDTFTSKESRSNFQKFGVNPNEVLPLLHQAGSQMGAAFTSATSEKQQGILSKAAELQQARVMSTQQYVGNLGQLTQVGGGQKQLEEIMSNAVARGVGNAKNISDLVSIVTSISSKTGANVAAGAVSIVGRTVNALSTIMPGAENEQLRLARTQSALENINSRITSTGMDFPSITAFASLSQKFQGVSAQSRLVAQRDVTAQDISQIETLQKRIKGGNKEEAAEAEKELVSFTRLKGISEFYVNEKGGLKKDIEGITSGIKGSKATAFSSYLLGTDADAAKEFDAYMKSGGKTKLSEKTRGAVAAAARVMPEEAAAIIGKDLKDSIGIPINTTLTGGAKAQADIRQIQAEAAGKVIQQGLDATGGKSSTEAFRTIADDFKKVFENFNPTDMQTKAVEAANQMNVNFENSIGKFDEAVNKLVDAIKLIPAGTKVKDTLSSMGSALSNQQGTSRTSREDRSNPSSMPTIRVR